MGRYSHFSVQDLKSRRSIFLVFTFCILIFFVASCGKKEVKRASEDSIIATEAFGIIEKIRDAYIKGDMLTIERNTTKDGFKVITADKKTFDSAEMTFSPVWVEITDSVVNVNVSWKGVWQKAGKTNEERGMAVFVLKGTPLKVDNILRANPFRHPE